MSGFKTTLRRRLLGRRFQQNILDDHQSIQRFGNRHYLLNHPELSRNKFTTSLNAFEYSVFSQNGEDGILLYLLSRLGAENHYMVEIGVQDGRECNSANLTLNFGWQAALFEGSSDWATKAKDYFSSVLMEEPDRVSVSEGMVMPDNINEKMIASSVPEQIDILSIDIDSYDYWLWQAFDHATPTIVVMEYNASFGPEWSVTMPHPNEYKEPEETYEYYHGASISALDHLAREKGYSLVGCDSKGVNAFFVLKEKAEAAGLKTLTAKQAFKPHFWRTRAHTQEAQLNKLKGAPLTEIN